MNLVKKKHKRYLSLFTLFALILSMFSPIVGQTIYAVTKDDMGSMHVLVKDEVTNEGLKGVSVTVSATDGDLLLTDSTNDTGELQVDNVPIGTYTVSIDEGMDGYDVYSEDHEVIVSSKEVTTLELIMTPEKEIAIEEEIIEDVEVVEDEEIVEDQEATEEETVEDEQIQDEETEIVEDEIIEDKVIENVVIQEAAEEETVEDVVIQDETTDALTITQSGGGTEHYVNEQMLHNVEVSLSGNATTLYNHSIKIEMDKEFLRNGDFVVPKPEQSSGVEMKDEGSKRVAYVKIPELAGGNFIGIPITSTLYKAVTNYGNIVPEGYELMIKASIVDADGNVVKEANDVTFITKYNKTYGTKTSAQNGLMQLGMKGEDGEIIEKNQPIALYQFDILLEGRTGDLSIDYNKTRGYKSHTLVDTLPEGAVFDPELEVEGVKINKGWTLSDDETTITREWEATEARPELALLFPDIKEGESVTNKVEVTSHPYEKKDYETLYSTEATRSHRAVYGKVEGIFSKRIAESPFVPASRTNVNNPLSWNISLNNPLEQSRMDNVVIEDYKKEDGTYALDERMYFDNITFRSDYDYIYNPNKVVAYVGDSGTEQIVEGAKNGTFFDFPEDTRGYRVEYDSVVPKGRILFGVSARFKNPDDIYWIKDDVENNNVFNEAEYSLEFVNINNGLSGGLSSGKSKDSYLLTEYKEEIDILKERNGDLSTVSSAGESVGFTVKPFGFNTKIDNFRSVDNFQLVDLLPVGFTLDRDYMEGEFDRMSETVKDYKIVQNYKNSGREALIVNYVDGITPQTSSLSFTVLGQVTSLSSPGENTNEIFATADGLDGVTMLTKTKDIYDINENGLTDDYILYDSSYYLFAPVKEVVVRKSAKTDVTDWTPIGVKTKAEGTLQNKISIINYLDTPVETVTLYDIFPYEDDVAIVKNEAGTRLPRGSEFSNSLQGAISSPEGFTVYYTTDTPLEDEADAVSQMSWVTSLSDYSKAKAIKIVMDEGRVLESQETADFILDMKAPSNVTNMQRAYNSVAMSLNGGLKFLEGNKVFNEIETDVGTIKITKTDKDTLELLKGVEFILEQDDIEIDRQTTDDKGEILFDNLEVGDYIVRETKGLDGYQINDTSYPVTIGKDDIVQLDIKNEQILLLDIDVTKVWDDNNSEDRPEELVYKLSRKAQGELTFTEIAEGKGLKTDNYTYSFKDMELMDSNGNSYEYRIEEVVPDGYRVNIDGNAQDGFTVTNRYVGVAVLPDTGGIGALFVIVAVGGLVLVGMNKKQKKGASDTSDEE